MRFSVLKTALSGAILCGLIVYVRASEVELPQATSARVGGSTSIPYGWIDFCTRRPAECGGYKLPARDLELTSDSWKLLQRVNRQVNGEIEPLSNLEHWGTLLDHWDYPVDGKGDCKIYALWKRKLLIDEGWPRQALLMTVVRDLNGEGHAVLTVKTDHGDFILDNLTDEVRSWEATGYTFLKRQAQEDPNIWLDLGAKKTAGAAKTAHAPQRG